jgi:hypothetical protein
MHMAKAGDLAPVLEACFISPNESDRNDEPANVVDGLFAIARSITVLATELKASREALTERSKHAT